MIAPLSAIMVGGVVYEDDKQERQDKFIQLQHRPKTEPRSTRPGTVRDS